MSIKKLTPQDLAELGITIPNPTRASLITRNKEEPVSKEGDGLTSVNHIADDNSKEPLPCSDSNQAPQIDRAPEPQAPRPQYDKVVEDSDDEPIYAGDAEYFEDNKQDGDLVAIDIPDPALLLLAVDKNFRDGHVHLHPWQVQTLDELAYTKSDSLHPHKFCLCAANGSGKDAFVIAPFCIWFAISKIKSLVIITSSSGTQLTAQTENYIRSLAEKCNAFFGEEIFKIRQRYIKCLKSGSEIRMFATDEAGKAEGYHPMQPGAEMAIIVNEGKSVSEEIHGALKRCTGFNYWLEVSTPGEPFGFMYRAFTDMRLRFKTCRITAYDCPHISKEEIESDRIELGEHSALFRSMRLALFTSLGGQVVIPAELVEKLLLYPVTKTIGSNWKIKVGIDLAAGGDENVITSRRGNKLIKPQYCFRETDTTITADKIHDYLKNTLQLPIDYDEIYIDDGGVGHSITDMLVRKGWKNIRRVLNQSAAVSKKKYGNLGAEMWYIIKRIIEEGFFDVTQLDEKCRTQLCNRYYKQQETQGRITLESKKEAKAHGRPSPDRADSLILTFRGETLDDYIKADGGLADVLVKPKHVFTDNDSIVQYYQDLAFGEFEQYESRHAKKSANGSLNVIMNRSRPHKLQKFGYDNN